MSKLLSLLRDLYVTWDITDGVIERDFGFVRCGQGKGGAPTLHRGIRSMEIRSSYMLPVSEFEELLPNYLQLIFQNPMGKLTERERLDSQVFRLEGVSIRTPGPIGILIVKGSSRAIFTFNDRFEAAT